MSISIFVNRRFVFVTLFVLCGFCSTLEAAPTFLGRKTKMATCEIMLNSRLKAFTTEGSPLPALRELKFRLQKQIADRSNDGIGYDDTYYLGSIESLRHKKANLLIERLNGVESTLTSTHLDRQILSYEIRGGEIEKALQYLELKERELDPIYQKIYEKEWSQVSRVASSLVAYALAWTVADLSLDLLANLQEMSPETLRRAFFETVLLGDFAHGFIRPGLIYNKTRLDSDFFKLKKFLRDSQRNKNEIFISGSSIKLPTEFHQMLMSKNDNIDTTARQIAIRENGGSYIEKIYGRWFKGNQDYNELLHRQVANAGDLQRSVFLDHLVYFDEETSEPVWMFFYRSYQNRPQGTNNKKKTKEEAREQEKDWQWLPGLSPVPAHN